MADSNVINFSPRPSRSRLPLWLNKLLGLRVLIINPKMFFQGAVDNGGVLDAFLFLFLPATICAIIQWPHYGSLADGDRYAVFLSMARGYFTYWGIEAGFVLVTASLIHLFVKILRCHSAWKTLLICCCYSVGLFCMLGAIKVTELQAYALAFFGVAYASFMLLTGIKQTLAVPMKKTIMAIVLSVSTAAALALIVKNTRSHLVHRSHTASPVIELGPGSEAFLNKLAPDFTIYPIGQNPVKLSSMKGKVVILDYWAKACPPCCLWLPQVDAIAKDYRDKNIQFYAIDSMDSGDVMTQYFKEKQISLSAALDQSGEASNAFHTISIPTTVLIGKDGFVRSYHVGFAAGHSDKILREEIDSALK